MLRLLLGDQQVQLVRKGQVGLQYLEDREVRLNLPFLLVQPHRLLQSLQCRHSSLYIQLLQGTLPVPTDQMDLGFQIHLEHQKARLVLRFLQGPQVQLVLVHLQGLVRPQDPLIL